MESVSKIEQVRDPLTRGERALDRKTRELAENVGKDRDYDLLLRNQPYRYSRANTPPQEFPDEVDSYGVHEKG